MIILGVPVVIAVLVVVLVIVSQVLFARAVRRDMGRPPDDEEQDTRKR